MDDCLVGEALRDEQKLSIMKTATSNTPGQDPVSFIDDWEDEDTTSRAPCNSPGLVNQMILEAIFSNSRNSSTNDRGDGEPQPKICRYKYART